MWIRGMPIFTIEFMSCILSIHLISAAGGAQKLEYNTSKDPGVSYPDWMSTLNGDMSLASLSIPGTHDTMTYRGHGGPLSRCQSWPLHIQLDAGIRFLDIRFRHVQNLLPIYHGVVYQTFKLYDVLFEVTNFLRYHPNEAVLMRVQQEYKEKGNNRSMEETFKENIGRFDSNYFLKNSYVPKLGQARGMIVILDDFAVGQLGVNYNHSEIADNCQVETIIAKDIDAKRTAVMNNLKRAHKDEQIRLFVTYSSGTGLLAYPNAVVERMNRRLYDFINRNPGRNKWGTVVMDFPGGKLAEKIIISNYLQFAHD